VVVNVALRWIFAAAAARLLTRWADDDHGLRPRVLPISLLLLLRQVLLLLLALLTAFEFQSSAEGGIAEKGRDEAVLKSPSSTTLEERVEWMPMPMPCVSLFRYCIGRCKRMRIRCRRPYRSNVVVECRKYGPWMKVQLL
jgi:hypothetical protein